MPTSIPQALAASAPAAVMPEAPSLLQHFMMMGFVGYALLLLGLVALWIVLRHWRSLAIERLMPEAVRREAEAAIGAGKIDRALEVLGDRPGFFGVVLEGGLAMRGLGIEEMLAGAERAASRETMERADGIANIARMAVMIVLMGVFGTVTCLIVSLDRLSQMRSAGASEYAIGAAESLVSLAFGVFFALLTLGAFFMLDRRLTKRSILVHAAVDALLFRAAKHP